MRPPAEIAFRFRQQAANLWMLLRQPAPKFIAAPATPLGLLPDPVAAEQLPATKYRALIVELADRILSHRFPIFGLTIDAGAQIDWRRDYVHGRSTPLDYSPRIPFLDFARAGDHKIVWELNRHQHLVILAQAWRLTRHAAYCAEIERQLQSWWEQNPLMRGINWASALEAAFRALSWIWTYHLAGAAFPDPFRKRWIAELWRHGLFIEHNLSIYFSPNTHLLGEAVALHAIGKLFPTLPRAGRWRRLGRRLVLEQMAAQVKPDGSHFEQSAYYHLYALDFFLLHHILEPAPYVDRLRAMADFLAAIMGPARLLPLIGDDDGGRVFHPYGERARFGRATLATAARVLGGDWPHAFEDTHEQAWWWLGPCSALPPSRWAPASRLFPDSGLAVMCAGQCHLLADAGPFGWGGAGHSHSDTLSIVLWRGDQEILIDPGTYTYTADPGLRDWFRSSAAHSTVRVDGCDQAVPVHPFRWADKPQVTLHAWRSDSQADFLDASCRGAVTHRRRILLVKRLPLLFVADEVQGPAAQRLIEQCWHLGSEEVAARFAFPRGWEPERVQAWRSNVYGSKTRSLILRITQRAALPAQLCAALDLSADPAPSSLRVEGDRLIWSRGGLHIGADLRSGNLL